MSKMKLPNKPSDLIRVAVNDLIAVEKSKEYVVDMGSWHYPEIDDETGEVGKCAVCFGGSVMAKSLKVAKDDNVVPADMGGDLCHKLEALDYFRTGKIDAALVELCMDDRVNKKIGDMYIPPDIEVVDYKDSPEKFKKQMLELADYLQVAGI